MLTGPTKPDCGFTELHKIWCAIRGNWQQRPFSSRYGLGHQVLESLAGGGITSAASFAEERDGLTGATGTPILSKYRLAPAVHAEFSPAAQARS